MAEVTEEYKSTIRKCHVTTKAGPASDPRDVVEVDWSPVLMGVQGSPGMTFLLGWEPRGVPKAYWVDEQLQYAPAPAWAQSDTYITALEAENAALKAQLAKGK